MYAVLTDIPKEGFTNPTGWDDASVTEAIKRASLLIDRYTGCVFEPFTRTMLLDGNGSSTLDLRQLITIPCISVTSILYRSVYDATDNFGTVGELIADNTYVLSRSGTSIEKIEPSDENRRASILDRCTWELGHRNYKFTGSFGSFLETPLDIKRACILLTREEMKPGYLAKFEQKGSESFPDGYSYSNGGRQIGQGTVDAPLSGYSCVDKLIAHYVSANDAVMVSVIQDTYDSYGNRFPRR